MSLARAKYNQATCRSQRLLRNRLARRRRHLLIAGFGLAESEGPCSNSTPKAETAARAFARPRGASERSELGASEIMAESEGLCSNTLDDVLCELADWNIILSEYEEELREIYGSDE